MLLEYMDKWTVLDDILPILPKIPSREPAVLMSILGIYQVTMSHSKLGITKDLLATKVLPFLIPLTIDSNLNLSQFNAYIKTIKDMVSRLESEYRSKLEQSDKMRQGQKTTEITKITGQDEKASKTEEPKTMMDQFLSGFWCPTYCHKQQADPGISTCLICLHGIKAQYQGITDAVLTLEEKQRQAQKQEQQRRYKEQKPFKVAASKASSVAKSQPKDLTASLVTSNPMGQPRMMGNYGMMGQQSVNSNVMAFSQGGVSSPSAFSNYSSGGITNQRPKSSRTQPTLGTNNKQSFDLSAFDSLLPSTSQPKMSINQMTGVRSQGGSYPMSNSINNMSNQPMRPQAMSGSSMMLGQPGMLGNPSFMGTQSMMGNQGMIGNQGLMGQQNMIRQPLPMMQGQFNVSMNNMSMSQNQGSFTQNSGVTNNDISDIFG